ncbi:hypothetical protein SAMN04489812_1623 [Microlunatus soli]|uniref:Uncharacterized protein n=1 Tax=Microlunatus soli TaxID=630515 RepID=A0A1H1RET1_9ACTN|nr:hypothetical protein SAMN04489812_1623 [Microlunatus soli]
MDTRTRRIIVTGLLVLLVAVVVLGAVIQAVR